MFQGNCPDTLMNVRPVELNVEQMANLLNVWPAAFDAVELLNQRMDAEMLNLYEGDLPDAPLWIIVRWFLAIRDLTSE